MPEEKLVRLCMEVVGITFLQDLACVRIDPVRHHFPSGIRSAIPNQDLAIFAAGRLVQDGSKFAIVEALIPLDRCRNLTNLDWRLLRRIRLDLEDVDGMTHAGAVPVTQEDAVAGDPESAGIAFAIEVSTSPLACGGILHRRHGYHPMQMLKVSKQMQLFFEGRRTRTRIFLRRERVHSALTVNTNRGHLSHRRGERAGLTPRRIFGEVHTWAGLLTALRPRNQGERENDHRGNTSFPMGSHSGRI